jgi:hypothetical protein
MRNQKRKYHPDPRGMRTPWDLEDSSQAGAREGKNHKVFGNPKRNPMWQGRESNG